MSPSKKKRREDKKQGRFNLFPPDASLGIIGGILLAYMILLGHPFSHPLHWIYSGVGGVVGYAFVLLWTYRPSWMRPTRGQRLWLNRGVASLLAALFIVSFVILGYMLPENTTSILPPTSFSAEHVEIYPPKQVNTEPIPILVQEHIMEHVGDDGPGIIVSYNCVDYQCEPNLVQRLTDLVESYSPRVFLAPFPDMDAKIALTTQGELVTLDAFDEARIRKFIDQNLN